MKTKDLHAMTMPDLQKQLKTSRQELFNLRFQMATGQLANHRQIRSVRHALAQILTEMHEKEDEGQQPEPEAVAAPVRGRRSRAAAPTPASPPTRGARDVPAERSSGMEAALPEPEPARKRAPRRTRPRKETTE